MGQNFIKYRDKSFKLRPELADLFCQVLKNIDSPGSSNSKDDNITKFCPTFSVKISHITETMDQCFTTCDDVTDHQSTVRNHGQFEGFITVFYEGIFSTYQDKGVSGINLPDVDFYWKGGIVAPEFRRETLSMCSPLFEKCIIYDGGARRYEIHEHVEEVLEFWEGILERADKIDFKELLDEKLGYPTPISYEDWLAHNHYQEIRPADTKWLYRQEQGYIESMKNITLRELAEQRIGEFRSALRKYIL